jgi:Cu/Ag efflux protein CusF
MLEMLVAVGLMAMPLDHGHNEGDHHHAAAEGASSTVSGEVLSVDATTRMALVRHATMHELSMPAMSMNFRVADTVEMGVLVPGSAVTITVMNGENGLEIIATEAVDTEHAGH